jgi:hypothetical protein
VIRGGSWNNDAVKCRSANRNNNPPDNRNTDIGFRLSSSRQRSVGVCSRTHPLHPRLDPRPGPAPARAGQKRPARRLPVGSFARKPSPGTPKSSIFFWICLW